MTKPNMNWVDGTVGAGGHAAALLKAVADAHAQAWVIGVDRDPHMLTFARQRLHDFSFQGHRIDLHQSNYDNLPQVLAQAHVKPSDLDAILLDLGVSQFHFAQAHRGFSFSREGPLDMRIDPQNGLPTAHDLLSRADEKTIAGWLHTYGEEAFSRPIARAIKKALQEGSMMTTLDLADLVTRTIPRKSHPRRIHPATKTFQALRLVVNKELEHLERFLTLLPTLLTKQGARIAIISFHSLEDRMVKSWFRQYANPCICPPRLATCVCGKKPILRILTRKPVVAGRQERTRNPAARSAKLRVAERL